MRTANRSALSTTGVTDSTTWLSALFGSATVQSQRSARGSPSAPTTRWTPSSAGSRKREVGAAVGAARLAPLERRARDQPRQRDRGRRAAARAVRRRVAGPAQRQTASRVATVGGSKRHVGQLGRRPPRPARRARRRGGSAAEHEALAERVRGQAVGAVEPGAGALADREQARQRGARRRGRRRCRRSGSGPAGATGTGSRSGSSPAVAAGGEHVRKALRRRARAGRARRGRCRRPRSGRGSPRVTWSRGASSSVNRRPAASSSVAPSPRTASVIRAPSCSACPGSASAVGWNWQSSRSASSAPAAWASTAPAPIAPHGFVVRLHSAAPPPVVSTVAAAAIGAAIGEHPGAALAVAPQGERRGALEHLDRGARRRPARPAAR